MNDAHFDVVVVGLGGAGSSTVFHLARRGVRVLGVDCAGPDNVTGASHGGSRIVRYAYAEGTAFMPLLRRAHALWDELGQISGSPVLRRCGVLFAGRPASSVVADTLAAAASGGSPLETLNAASLSQHSPLIDWPEDSIGCFDSRAGLVRPESVVRLHLELSRQYGAALRFGEKAFDWTIAGDGVRIGLSTGDVYADRLVLCAGAWSPSLAPGFASMRSKITVQRQVQHWFDTPASHRGGLDPASFPVHVWDDDGLFYAMPMLDGPTGGMKCCLELSPAAIHVDEIDRDISPGEIGCVQEVLRRHAPWAGAWMRGAVCHYGFTPDNCFLVGVAPEQPRVILACGLGGHGFKFTPAIGEAVADLACGVADPNDERLAPFGPSRFLAALGQDAA